MWCKIIVLVKTRKYDNTPFPKKISCSRDVLNTYARASSKGKKVILVLCTHKTPCLNVHRFLRVKVHILCVTNKAFNKIIFSSLQYKHRRLWRLAIVTHPQMQADWVWAAGSAERDLYHETHCKLRSSAAVGTCATSSLPYIVPRRGTDLWV